MRQLSIPDLPDDAVAAAAAGFAVDDVPASSSPTPQATLASESAPVAAAESRTAAPLQVSAMVAVARSRLLAVGEGALLVEVAALLSSAQISVVVVCDAGGVALGIITETMLVQCLGLRQADFFSTPAGAVMTREFSACAPDDLLSAVLATMHQRGLIHMLLVDAERRALGVVNARDGLRALLAAGNREEALLRDYVMGVGYR